MKNILDPDRQGYFECWLAIATPHGLKKCVRGVCEGNILTEEKGGKGFGYDSLFVKYEYGKTFSELEENVKNRISHRRKALDKLHLLLESLAETP
jgi:XTP/dITP diphosphohydrolase